MGAAMTPTQKRRRRREIRAWAEMAAREILDLVRGSTLQEEQELERLRGSGKACISKHQLLSMRVVWKVVGCGACAAPPVSVHVSNASGAALAPGRQQPLSACAHGFGTSGIHDESTRSSDTSCVQDVSTTAGTTCIEDVKHTSGEMQDHQQRHERTGRQSEDDINDSKLHFSELHARSCEESSHDDSDGDAESQHACGEEEDDDMWCKTSLGVIEKLRCGGNKFSFPEIEGFRV